MSRIFNRLGFTTLALVAGSSVVGFAQDSTTGAISGIVSGPNGALIAGAKVILEGGRGQVVRVTDASGAFKASGLIPGQYSITVVAPGFETRKLSAAASINSLTPIRVTVSKTAGAVVEVVSSAQALDTTTQTSGTSFSSEVIASLPLGRSFASAVNLAPGVASSGIDNNNPAIGGGSGLDNAYIIDGVNTTATGYGANGSYSIVYGSLGTGINNDFIGEVQVKSFGLDAEFGGAGGGLVNAVTKTGDNDLHAQVFAYLSLDGLQAKQKLPHFRPYSQIITPSWDANEGQEFGFTVAGPIIKDTLFYFVGYNPNRTSQKRTQIDPNQKFFGRQIERKTQVDAYYAKLNWMITTNHSLEFSLFGDPGKLPLGANRDAMVYGPTYTWEEVQYGGSSWSLKYNGIFFNDLLVEAQASQSKNKFKRVLDPQVQNSFYVTDAYSGAFLSPGPGYVDGTDDKNKQWSLKLTKTFGDLELKAGYSREDLIHKGGNTYQGPAGFVDPHTGATGQPYSSGAQISQRYYVDRSKLTPATQALYDTGGIAGVTLAGADLAAITPYYRITRARTSPPLIPTEAPFENYFVQGKYSWNNRLFVKAGLRWDSEDMKGAQETYKFKAKDAMAPRLSITLDPAGDGTNKIYAFYGKYFSKVPLDLCVRSLSQEIGVSRSDFYNINSTYSQLSGPIQSGTGIWDVTPSTNATNAGKVGSAISTNHFVGSAGFLTPVLPNTKLPYINEFVLGWDSQNSNGLKVSNRFVFRNLGRVLEDIGIDGGNNLPYYIGNPGQNTWQLAAEAAKIDPTLRGTSSATWPDPVRNYYAYEFEVSKTTARWAAFMNLRLSRLEGNYEGNYNGMNGQSDPNITSLYDMTTEYLTSNADGLGEEQMNRGLQGDQVYATGPLSNDRALILNAGGSYNWENGFSVSGVMKFQTGTPLSKLYGYAPYDNAGEIPAGGRGAYGRTPATYNFDVSGSYTWKLAGKHRLMLRADVFNFFNASKPVTFDQYAEIAVGAPNANYGAAASYQQSRRVRLGVKYSF